MPVGPVFVESWPLSLEAHFGWPLPTIPLVPIYHGHLVPTMMRHLRNMVHLVTAFKVLTCPAAVAVS